MVKGRAGDVVSNDLARRRPKRADGTEAVFLDLSAAEAVSVEESTDVAGLDDALRELSMLDARKAQIVELRFFGGLTFEEIAEVLGVAPVTVSREWAKARAWLQNQVSGAVVRPVDSRPK